MQSSAALDVSTLDTIDKDLVTKIRELPGGGSIFDEHGKIDMSALLLLFKAGFTHMREREVDAYYESIKKRQFALSPGNLNIDRDYALIIQAMFKQEKQQEQRTLELACQALNECETMPAKMTPMHLEKFFQISCQQDEEFARVAQVMKKGIAGAKPKNWIHKPDLSEKQAREAFDKRKELIAEFSKQGDYKDLVEEVYMLIIAKAEKDNEFEKMQLKAYLQGAVIKCKANDCLLHKYGYDEMQIEEAIAKFKLDGEDDKTKSVPDSNQPAQEQAASKDQIEKKDGNPEGQNDRKDEENPAQELQQQQEQEQPDDKPDEKNEAEQAVNDPEEKKE